MEVNVQKAVKMFFSNSSFEMIYNEALANALDAGANEIRINISEYMGHLQTSVA